MRVIQLCGSFGEQCGIARYSLYVSDCLTSIGITNTILRSCAQVVEFLAGAAPDPETYILVQHEYGLYDYMSKLSSGDTTAGIISTLDRLTRDGTFAAAAFVMHTIVIDDHVLNFANKQILSSPFPVYHLNRLGSQVTGVQFLEHGVVRMPGSNIDRLLSKEISIGDFAAHQAASRSIGSFGLLSANKQPRRIIELASQHNFSLVANFATRNPADAQRFEKFVSAAGISARVGFDFLPEAEILERLKDVSFVVSFQDDFNHFATTGSARFLLNFGVPLVLNSTTPFMDLSDVAVYDDGYGSSLSALLANPDLYASKVEAVLRFYSNNTMDMVYKQLLADLPKHFADKKQAKGRHIYYHNNLLTAPSVTAGLRYFRIDQPDLQIGTLIPEAPWNFCAVPPETVRDNFLDTSEPISSRQLLEGAADQVHDHWQRKGVSEFEQARNALDKRTLSVKPAIRLKTLDIIPNDLQDDYLSTALHVDSAAVAAVKAIPDDFDTDRRLSTITDTLRNSPDAGRIANIHFIRDAMTRRTFFSSEIDVLPILERAFVTALILDRRPPDEPRLRLFKTLYNAGAVIADFVGSTEFENALIDLTDSGFSSRYMKAVNGDHWAGMSEQSTTPFWQNYIAHRYTTFPVIQSGFGEDDAPMPLHADRISTNGWSEFADMMRLQRFRFPTSAMEAFIGLANDRPWFQIALFSLSLKGARIISSCREFSSSWTKTVHVSLDSSFPDFDYFLVHKDHFARAKRYLQAIDRPLSLAFANEVFYVITPAENVTEPYAGIHGGSFEL